MWISRGLRRHTVHHRVGTPSGCLCRKDFNIGLDSGYRHRVCDEGRHRGTLRTIKKSINHATVLAFVCTYLVLGPAQHSYLASGQPRCPCSVFVSPMCSVWNRGKWPDIHENGQEIEEMAGKSWTTSKMAGSVSSCGCSVCVRNVGNLTYSEHFLEAPSNREFGLNF